MKALILGGGFATRLEPVTYFIPKPLLPIGVGGKPIIEYSLEDVAKCGIKNIIISTNSKFFPYFEYWLNNRLAKNQLDVSVKFVVENATNNNEKFGAIKGIAYAIEQEKIEEDLIVIAGDNLYDFSVNEIIDHFEKNRKPTIALYDISSKDEAKKFGVVEINGNMVVSFDEKPEDPKTSLISTAIYIFPKESLHYFGDYLKEKNNPDKIGIFIKWLIDKTEVHGYIYKGKWYDIGTIETYKKVFDEYTKRRNGDK
jgi:glucose-1-phosphate thymidylyltransferase